MKIYHSIDEIDLNSPTAITVGTFDGVHRGHQQVIQTLIEAGEECSCPTLLVTFNPHPQTVVGPRHGKQISLLSSPEEKLELLQSFPLSALMVIPFTREFSQISYHQFVKNILIERFRVKIMVIGHDHAFGRNREGHEAQLRKDAEDFGFRVKAVPQFSLEAEQISSTRIRHLLADGKVELAADLLGRPYSLSGRVVPGDRRGSGMGFPTANIRVDFPNKLIPGKGVYAVDVLHREARYKGMMNIGHRPTFNYDPLTLEVHIFKFAGSIYGQQLQIEFKKFIREEREFPTLDELRKQLTEDKAKCKNI